MSLIVKTHNNPQPYSLIWQLMRNHVRTHHKNDDDECWLLQHQPTYTVGPRTPITDILKNTTIPIIPTDRGGLATYHGPGQWITYVLFHLSQRQLTILQLMDSLEACVIEILRELNLDAHTIPGDRGIFISERKIASVGLRSSRNMSYHGFSINADLDLSPFNTIKPCGQFRTMTSIKKEKPTFIADKFSNLIAKHILQQFSRKQHGSHHKTT